MGRGGASIVHGLYLKINWKLREKTIPGLKGKINFYRLVEDIRLYSD